MSATVAEQDRVLQIPPGMKGPLAFSGVFHIGIVILAIVGLPYFKAPPEPMTRAIAIEILPIAELTTTNRAPVQAPPKPPEEIKEKPKEKPPAPPKVDTVEPPKDIPKPPQEKPKPKPKPVTPPPPTEKLAPPEEKPVEKPKPEEKPVEQQQQQEDFSSLLKNLQDSQPDIQEDVPVTKTADATPVAAPAAPFSQQLTMNEFDLLTQQLQRCWSIQAGARYAEDLVVEVRLIVNRERRVMSASIVDQWRYGQDSYFRAAADSAIRAVNSPQCEILNVPPEKYDVWKDMIVTFDPRDML
jgi:outer membrane biosynthesis protein TonB